MTKKVLSFEANDMIFVTRQAWFCEHDGKTCFWSEDMQIINALAWKPLPDPYKEGLK